MSVCLRLRSCRTTVHMVIANVRVRAPISYPEPSNFSLHMLGKNESLRIPF